MSDDIQQEERAIYGIIIVTILPVIVAILVEHGTFDVGGTLSLIIVALGVIGLVAGLRVASGARLPRARVYRRPRRDMVRLHRVPAGR